MAGSRKIPALLPGWILQLWTASQSGNPSEELSGALIDNNRCPIFHRLTITCSGLDNFSLSEVRRLVDRHGGSYSASLKYYTTTHLVVNRPTGEKYKYALEWKINIVSLSWIHSSIKAGYCLNPKDFKVKDNEPQQVEEAGSVTRRGSVPLPGNEHFARLDIDKIPRPETLKQGSYLSSTKIMLWNYCRESMGILKKFINRGGGIRLTEATTCVTHVVTENYSQHLAASLDLNDLFASSKTASSTGGPFHLSPSHQHRKRPFIVNHLWLVESVKGGLKLDERKYQLVNDEEKEEETYGDHVRPTNTRLLRNPAAGSVKVGGVPNPPAPKTCLSGAADSSREVLTDQETSTNRAAAVTITSSSAVIDGTGCGGLEMDAEARDLLKQYSQCQPMDDLPPIEGHVDDPTTTTNGDGCGAVQGNKNYLEDSDDGGDSDSGSGSLFKSKTFNVFNLPDIIDDVSLLITEHGGHVLTDSSKKTPPADFTVVSLFCSEADQKQLEHGGQSKLVTLHWLQCCVDEGKLLLPISLVDFHRPIRCNNLSVKPLKDCVICVSGFCGLEREGIYNLAKELGASIQEKFVRKNIGGRGLFANTHLITREAEGAKYRAALNWNLPPLHKSFLFDCLQSGKRVSEEDYRIEKFSATSFTGDVSPQLLLSKDGTTGPRSLQCQPVSTITSTAPTNTSTAATTPTKVVSTTITTTASSPLAVSADDVPPPPSIIQTHPASSADDTTDAYASPPSTTSAAERDTTSIVEKTCLSVDAAAEGDAHCVSADLPPRRSRHFSGTRHGLAAACDIVDTHEHKSDDNSTTTSSDVLCGVVAYIAKSLTSASANLDKSDKRLHNVITSLGGRISHSLNHSVTHFIFQSSSRDVAANARELKAAAKADGRVIVVSPHWISACKEANKRLPEVQYHHAFNPSKSLNIAVPSTPPPSSQSLQLANPARKLSPSEGGRRRQLLRQQQQQQQPSPVFRSDWSQPSEALLLQSRSYHSTSSPSQPVSGTKGATGENYNEECDTEVPPPPYLTNHKATAGAPGGRGRAASSNNQPPSSIQAAGPPPPLPNNHQVRDDDGAITTSGASLDLPIDNGDGGIPKEMQEEFERQIQELDEVRKEVLAHGPGLSPPPLPPLQPTTTLSDGSTPQMKRSHKKQQRQHFAVEAPVPVQPRRRPPFDSQTVQVTWEDSIMKRENERISAYLDGLVSTPPQYLSPPRQPVEVQREQEPLTSTSSSPAAATAAAADSSQCHDDLARGTISLATTCVGGVTKAPAAPAAANGGLFKSEAVLDLDAAPNPPRVIQFSSFATTQVKEKYRGIVEELGGQVSDIHNFDPIADCLIAGRPSRNEKFLATLAAGHPILHPAYLDTCSQQGKLIADVAPFLWGNYDYSTDKLLRLRQTEVHFANATTRWWRAGGGSVRNEISAVSDEKNYGAGRGAFSNWIVLLLIEKTKTSGFTRLLQSGGAVVLTPPPHPDSATSTTSSSSPLHLDLTWLSKSLNERKLTYIFASEKIAEITPEDSIPWEDMFRSHKGTPCIGIEFICDYLVLRSYPDEHKFHISKYSQYLEQQESRSEHSTLEAAAAPKINNKRPFSTAAAGGGVNETNGDIATSRHGPPNKRGRKFT